MMEGTKPKILMIAYACNPEGSGEHWLGWGWAEQASRSFHVHLITTTNHREEAEKHAKIHGIEPHFIPLPDWLRWSTSYFGRFGSWLRKSAWEHKASRFATELHAREKFALVHQTTFHTFRVPFSATKLGIPSVWGPIAGGEYIPADFYRFIGPLILPESVRRLFNKIWLALPPIQKSLQNTDAIFVSNHTTLGFLPLSCRDRCVVVPPNAMRPEDEKTSPSPRPDGSEKFRVLYVGHCLATRAIPLVFHALSRLKIKDYEFNIVGSGPALKLWKKSAASLGVGNHINFMGQVGRAELQSYYDKADVFVFPALRDSGGSALLEAMSKGIPVVCLDWGGPAEIIDDSSGIKVPVTRPQRTIQDVGVALLRLYDHPNLRARFGMHGRERALRLFTWETKRRLLESTYHRLIGTE